MAKNFSVVRLTNAEIEAEIKASPNGEFFAWWDRLIPTDASDLQIALDTAENEQAMQTFLQAKPQFLIQHLRGGHGRWVIPQKKLGSEHVTDFMVGDKHSFGHEWYAVELESPKAKMFNKSGDPSATLQHAIRQIMDWRAWLTVNLDYARRLRTESGLGLADIRPNLRGYIIIGRREDCREETSGLRRQLMDDTRIEIHSYDWLLDLARGRGGWFTTYFGQQRSEHER